MGSRSLAGNAVHVMSRTLVTAGLFVLGTALVAAGPVSPARAIDLNAPGALEALQQSRPAHFDKVRRILEGLPQQPDPAVSRWMRVSFDARAVNYPPFILTSFPAQRRLSFVLDDTRYEAIVILTTVPARALPLR
jgi:hypothetical protein